MAPKEARHKETVYLDCVNAAWQMTADEMHPKADRRFSRSSGRPNYDFLVPEAFI